MIVLLKNDKQILVICLIIQHEDNNKRSGKKFAKSFTHLY